MSLARDALRYFGVSAVAFAVDYSLLVALHRGMKLHYLVAASAAFAAGLLVAWAASSAFVFQGRRRLSRAWEFAGFVLTGVIGLIITQVAMLTLVDGLGAPAEFAKIPVAGFVFLFNFLSRRILLFAPAATA